MKKLIVTILAVILLFTACGDVSGENISLPPASKILQYSVHDDFKNWVIEVDGCKYLVTQTTGSTRDITTTKMYSCR